MGGTDENLAEFQRLYAAGLIDGVAVVTADTNACRECAELADTVYLPSRLPTLPIAACATDSGCRCRYETSFTVYE